MLKRIAVIGAGGFAREVKWLISEINRDKAQYEFCGFLVSDLAKLTERDSKDEVLGDFSCISDSRIAAFAMGIGSPSAKLYIGDELTKRHPSVSWPALIHPTAKYDLDSCRIGRGVIVCAGVIATVNITIEDFAMLNLSCTVGHEARLGRGCVLNPTVNISGGVDVGDGVLVGTGAQILQYVKIGGGATVGAGAVVNKDVEPGSTVVGVPARSIKK